MPGPKDRALPATKPYRLASLVVSCAIATTGACAPSYHKAQRYRFHSERADRIENEARQRCEKKYAVPRRHFHTDGCSWFPDGSWQECCVEHDIDYWCGGTASERAASDARLRTCVARSYDDWRGNTLGWLMGSGVRLGGVPWLPTYFRWGYGHPFPSGYESE